MSFLSRLSLANRSLVALATVAILLFGGLIIPSLKEELFPSITFPALSILTPYPGASPSLVEHDVTDPIEQGIQGISGVQDITSYSNESASVIVVSFNYGTDLDKAQQTLAQSLNRLQISLPSGVTPQVQSYSFTDFPIIQLAVTADEDQQTLAAELKKDTVPSIEQINGVGTVNITGVRNQIVTVTLDINKLKANGITVMQVQQALQANNISIPAGDVSANGQTIPINVENTFNSLDDLNNVIIGVQNAQSATSASAGFPSSASSRIPAGFPSSQAATVPVKLSDVATVQETLSPSTSLTRTNGKPSLGISIVKTSDGNTVSISQKVHDQISSLEKTIGHNAQISVVSDQAPIVSKSIQDLTREGLVGAGFAIVVILLFLFSIRSTIVTAISIPLSIVIALIGLAIGNYTLNLLTLGGLTIAVGRVVDDSIVVLENIYRHLQRGVGKRVAIPAAVREVSRAVTASTLTTVAVFLPIAFTGGLVGELFSSFSLSITIALLASLFVSLTVIPVLAYWFLKSPKPRAEVHVESSHDHGHQEKETFLEKGYVALMSWLTGRWWQRALSILLAIGILVGSFSLAGGLQTNLFGNSGQNTYAVSLTLPPATSLDKADSMAKQVEDVIAHLPNLDTYQVTVGSGGMFASLTGGGSNTVSFSITAKSDADQTAFEDNLRSQLKDLKNLGGTLTVAAGNSGPSRSVAQIDVQASDTQTLTNASQQVQDAVSKIKGLDDVTSNLQAAAPQIDVVVDPQQALAHGMTAAQVAQTVRSVYTGATVTKVTLHGTQEDVDLFIGSPATTIADIKQLMIPTAQGSVAVGDLAQVVQTNGPTQITHINSNRTATISATITDPNVGAVSAAIQDKINKLSLPKGATVSLGGVSSDQASTFRSLGIAVLIAIALVYCIMVGTFRSFLQPIILLVSIPFATTGSILLLLITQTPLGAAALIGFLMLVGIVVTNAIVLLDLVRQYREKGMDARTAVIEGGKHRLRPILMTAIATILALLPMAIFGGSGGFISQPLAIVVIGGLTSSTVLTLLLVPTLYVIFCSRSKLPEPITFNVTTQSNAMLVEEYGRAEAGPYLTRLKPGYPLLIEESTSNGHTASNGTLAQEVGTHESHSVGEESTFRGGGKTKEAKRVPTIALLRFMKPYSVSLIFIMLFAFAQVMANLYLPKLMADIVDKGIAKGDTNYIWQTGGLMMVIAFGGIVAAVIGVYLSSKVAVGFGKIIREKLFRHVEKFSLHEFDTVSTASLITRTTNDTNQVQQVLVMVLNMMITAPFTLIAGVILALQQDAGLSWVLIAIIPILVISIALLMSKAVPLFRSMQVKLDKLNLIVDEGLNGVRVVRAFDRQKHEERRFEEANLDLTNVAVKVNQLMASLMPIMMLCLNVSSVAILWFGSIRVDNGDIQIGALFSFLQYAMQILFALIMFTMMFVMLPRAAASADRINEVLAIEPEIEDAKQVKKANTKRGYVEFRDVTFSYPGAEESALAHISFTAAPGEVTAIIGGTGSGKSTLISLVPRFYDIDSGHLLVDGVDVRAISQEDLRAKIGLIPQKAVLFSGTIAENIRTGKPDATDKEIRHAAEVAQASDFILEKDDGFNSPIAQGGTNVSGGQKQRLSIARALVRKPEIYLFDDSFSALDFKTDAKLRKALKQETQDATVLIVSQRVSTIMDANQIIVLDNGRIAGIGTHRELLRSCEVYREIVSSQLSESEIAGQDQTQVTIPKSPELTKSLPETRIRPFLGKTNAHPESGPIRT